MLGKSFPNTGSSHLTSKPKLPVQSITKKLTNTVSNVELLYNFGKKRTGSRPRILMVGSNGTADFMQGEEAMMMRGKLIGG